MSKLLNKLHIYFCIGLSIFLLAPGDSLLGQDPLFSQFNMAPMQFNPAFSGTTYAPLIRINSRVQWPSVSFAYNSFGVSYDQFFNDYHSGIGFAILGDDEGNGIIKTLKAEALYSYNLKVKDEHYLKAGLGFAMIQKRLNWEKLIFPDQVDPAYGFNGDYSSLLLSNDLKPENSNLLYPDLSLGLLYYSPLFYAGLSIRHINNPDDKILDGGQNIGGGRSNLFLFQSGAQIPLTYINNNKSYIHPGLLYAQQAGIKQLNISVLYDMGMVYAGIAYRHAFQNPDAAIFSLGFDGGLYKIAYSYDLTVSKLGAGSGGSHELGMTINFDHSEWFEKPGKYSDCFDVFR